MKKNKIVSAALFLLLCPVMASTFAGCSDIKFDKLAQADIEKAETNDFKKSDSKVSDFKEKNSKEKDFKENSSEANSECSSDKESQQEYDLSIFEKDIPPIDWKSDKAPTKEQLELASCNFSFYDECDNCISINGMGQWIRAEDVQVKTVKDILTGEVLYYAVYYSVFDMDNIGEEGEVKCKQMSRLYDVEGNLLCDWEEIGYRDAVGDWVTKYNQEEADSLVNIKTGKELKNIYYIQNLDDTHVFAGKAKGGLFYILSEKGDILYDSKDIDMNYSEDAYIRTFENYVVVEEPTSLPEGGDPDESYYDLSIFHQNGELLGCIKGTMNSFLETENVYLPYALCGGKIYDLSKGNGGELSPVFSKKDSVIYYDGELAILRDESHENETKTDYLYDVKRRMPISGRYHNMTPIDYEYANVEHEPSKYFYSHDDKGICVIDRRGKIHKRVELESIDQMQVRPYGVSCDYNEYTATKLFDLELNEIDMGKYSDMYLAFDSSGEELVASDFWVGSYMLSSESRNSRVDLLDKNFKPIITGATRIGELKNGTITVERGRKIGVMNYKGEWILQFNKEDFGNVD